MSVDLDRFAMQLQNIKNVKAAQLIGEDDQSSRIDFMPRDNIQLSHDLLTPDNRGDIMTRNMRAGNLHPTEYVAMRKAAGLVNWFESMKFEDPKEAHQLDELIAEVKADMNSIAIMSVSKKGWLIDAILHPTHTFKVTTDRAQNRIFGMGKKED